MRRLIYTPTLKAIKKEQAARDAAIQAAKLVGFLNHSQSQWDAGCAPPPPPQNQRFLQGLLVEAGYNIGDDCYHTEHPSIRLCVRSAAMRTHNSQGEPLCGIYLGVSPYTDYHKVTPRIHWFPAAYIRSTPTS